MQVKITMLSTQIHGVSKLADIEGILNSIGAENIMHIATIDREMLVVYKEQPPKREKTKKPSARYFRRMAKQCNCEHAKAAKTQVDCIAHGTWVTPTVCKRCKDGEIKWDWGIRL